MTSDSRRDWGRDVVADLVERVGPLDGRRVEVLASRTYTDPIRGLLARAGAVVIEPLAGLKLGEQLGWFTRQGKSSTAVTRPLGLSRFRHSNRDTPMERVPSPVECWKTPTPR